VAARMKVLFLGPSDAETLAYLRSVEENVEVTMERLTDELIDSTQQDFLVSHGYRYIIPRGILDRFPRRAINLHISLLPWNRGADPNLWSFIENTPKGVSIHYLDEGVDTGDIIDQREIHFHGDDTLRTSYERLQHEITALFREVWPAIRIGACEGRRQEGMGSYHRSRDKERVAHRLTRGWDTPVKALS
jgi:methionyl-tRNA formyltransferase